MRRSTWIVVGVVALTLVAASSVPRGVWRTMAEAPSRAAAVVSFSWSDAMRGLQYLFDGFIWQWITGALVCGALVLCARTLLRARRDATRRLVRRLARHGGTLATIARRAHLSQDAVRTVLAQQSASSTGGRKILPFGKSLRKNPAADGPGLVKGLRLAR